MKWTTEQQNVLDAKGNIIVSAAAGSGKTAVLAQRITDKVYAAVCDFAESMYKELGTISDSRELEKAQKERISDFRSIENMLVVTFTKAAAAEMKQRIQSNMEDVAKKETDEKAHEGESSSEKRLCRIKLMNNQSEAVQRANISTIHAFCTYLVSRHFYSLGLSQATHIGDDTTIYELTEKALSDTLIEYFNTHDTSMYMAFNGEDNLSKVLRGILKKMRTYPGGREWLKKAVEEYAQNPKELLLSHFMDSTLSELKESLSVAHDALMKAYDYAEGNNDKQNRLLDHRVNVIKRAIDSENILKMQEALSETFFPDDVKKLLTKSEEYKKCHTIATAIYNKTAETVENILTAAENMPVHYEYAKQIEELVLIFDDKLRAEKRKKAVIDFTDLEIFAYRILSDEKTAAYYRKYFNYIFVDEYQDTSPLQDEIIKRLMSPTNETFFVGDVKQSIYRFRDAEPKLFLRKLKEYKDGENSQRLDLTANFRSSDAVVDFTNTVFENIMTEKTGGIAYDDENKLRKEGEAKEGSLRFHIIDKTKQDEDTISETDEALEEITHATAQARLVVREIQYMLGTDFYDYKKKEWRKFTYSDIAILMRSVKDRADIFIRELVQAGIPVMASTEDSLYNSLEVEVFLNLLRIVDNRRQDIPLLSVMRSPVGNFTMDEIAQMRADTKGKRLDEKTFDMLDTLIFAAEQSENEKAADFLAKLSRWHELSHTEPVADLVQLLLTETGYYRFISVLPGGDTRCANLDKIVMLAKERNGHYGLSDFLRYIEKAQSAPSSSSRDAFSVNNAVSLMTMHKSKGLEFFAVIIPHIETAVIQHNPTSEAFIANERHLGLRMNINGEETRSIYYHLNAAEEQSALRADLMRLLYVAFTRARDTLVLIGADDKVLDRIDAHDNFDETPAKHITGCSRTIEWLYTALNRSKYKSALYKAADEGIAKEANYTFTCTPMTEFFMPEQEIDRSYFTDELDRIRETDTTEIDADAGWEYPHIHEARIVSKGSVTGFAEKLSDVQITYRSSTKAETTVSATARGSATHMVFEKIPLTDHTEKSVKEFIDSLVRDLFLSQEEADSIDVKKVAAFFRRPIYERMRKSERLIREQEFTCFCDAAMLIKGTDSKEQVLLQGKIDCCFIEDGKWVLLDYKTDSVDADDPKAVQERADSHREQLRLYAYVLTKITGIPVKECIISFTNAYECVVDIRF